MSSLRLTLAAAVAVALTALSLGTVFTDATWFWPTVVAVGAVAGGGLLARRLRLPPLTHPVLTLAALLGALTLLYARDVAPLVIVPGQGGVEALVELARSGFLDATRYTSPIAPYRGVVFLAVAGLGLVAVLVDFLAVSLRHPAVAGLPLLAVYCVPASVGMSTGWGAFVLGGAGWLALLVVDSRERVLRWGSGAPAEPTRPTGTTPGATPGASPRPRPVPVQTSPLAVVGRRIGAVALGAAVVLPPLLPTVDNGLLGLGNGLGLGSGTGTTVTIVDPVADLNRDLSRVDDFEVLRYRTDNGAPAYLRATTLDVYDGTKWQVERRREFDEDNRADRIAGPAGLTDAVPRTARTIDVEISDRLSGKWLPLPYPPVSVEIDGDWRWDRATLNVLSPRGTIRGHRYSARYLDLEPDPAALAAAGPPPESLRRYLDLPADMPASVQQTADQVTAGADTAYARALALQAYFRSTGGFTYSTERRRHSSRALEQFLLDKTGYCEQFAATMGIMARLVGIPARLNVGWISGERQPDGSFAVTTHDAHLWPELYFAGTGWVRFEPTPRSDGRTDTPAWTVAPPPGQDASAAPGAAAPGADATPSAAPSTGGPQDRGDLDGRSSSTSATDASGGGPDVPLLPVLLALGVLLLALTPAAVRHQMRRRRLKTAGTLAHAEAMWAEVRDTVTDLGWHWKPSETPRQAAARLHRAAGLDGPAAAALGDLARAVERSRYAGDPGVPGGLARQFATLRAALAARVSRRRRLRAALLPISAKRVLHVAGDRVADALDLLDAAGARLRAAVPLSRGRS